MKIAYVGNYTQPHCTEVHIALTLEDLGHEVIRLQENTLTRDWTRHLPNDIDLLLFTRTWGGYVKLEDLEWFRDRGTPTASYHLDLYVGLQRESGLKNDPFWKTDYVFTPDGSEQAAKVFKKMGINHYYIKPGVFKNECVMLSPNSDPSLGGDIVFVGGGAEYGHKEWPYRHKLVKWLEETYGSRYRKYGHPQRTVRNMDLNQLYANAKIVIGDSLCLNFNHPNYWSDRVYETIGRGGFIIHPFIEGMQEEFEDGENILFYNFNDFDQLKRIIDHYLDPANEQERRLIQAKGFAKVSRDCTYHNRLKQALDIIFPLSDPDGNLQPAVRQLVTSNFKELLMKDDIKINLGAGNDIKEGFVNVDLVKLPGTDVVHNLVHFPYPFEDNSATEIHAIDVVEHLPNYTKDDRPMVVAFVEEMHRILKPGGVLYIQTPGWKAEFLWIDPTHVRGFDIQTFDFFDPTKPFGQSTGFYSPVKFNVRAEELPNHNLRFWLTKT